MQSSPSLITRGSQPWPSLTFGSTGLARLDVADGQKCATDIPLPAPTLAVDARNSGDGCGFSRSTIRHRDSLNERRRLNATDQADRGAGSGVCGIRWNLRCYLTNFSKGRRRRPCGDFGSCDVSAGASCRDIASHKAFNSKSAIRCSFIRRSRTATETNSAISRSLLSRRTARQSSRVARTECNRSELATGVFSVAELAR